MLEELFIGGYSSVISALLVFMMILMMLSMSVRLMLTRRKKAYFSLTFSLILYALLCVLTVVLGDRSEETFATGAVLYFMQGLEVFSFIALNLGIFQLYNTTNRKVRFLVTLGTLITFAILGARIYVSEQLVLGPVDAAAMAQTHAFLNVWMDLYLYVLLLFCFYFITQAISQTGKYQTALVIYFLSHSAQVLNHYVFGDSSAVLDVAANLLPVLFFAVIFQLLFERVLELMQAVFHSAITDGLTGLYNRKFITRRLQQWMKSGKAISIIFCDIDDFKKLNDTQGHQRGDEALRQVAAIVIEEAEGIGLAGRYGGEEIVLILEDPKADTAKVAEKVRARVEKEVGVTISVGWSKARKGVSGEQLMRQADEAMYRSKSSGKNRVSAFAAK